MSNPDQDKGPTEIFWKVCPLLLMGLFLLPVLLHKTKDPTYWVIFVPAVAICVFPFSVAASSIVRIRIKAKLMRMPSGMELSDPEISRLSAKAAKWGLISVLIWICVFLIIAFMAMYFIRNERAESGWELVRHGQPKALSEGSQTHLFLCVLDSTLQFLWPIPLIALVFGALILFRLFLQRNRAKTKPPKTFWRIAPFCAVASFVIPIVLIFALGSVIQKIVRKETAAFLRNVSSSAVLKIDGQQIEDKNEIIKELAKMAALPAHGSHPTKRLRIEITDCNEGLVVELGRDSSRGEEYWVFYLGYGHTYVNEIGRIRTTLFDSL